jgi:hypothetical protein
MKDASKETEQARELAEKYILPWERINNKKKCY